MERLGLLAALLMAGHCYAQNLVPNGSFEEYDNCPHFDGYVEYATGWYNLHTNSADYFNSCNGGTVVGVPLNQFGYQFAADGDAYMGMATSSPWGGLWYREYIGIELNQPLIPGVPVCLSFKTAMGGFGSWAGNSTPYSCNGIGLKFFMQFPTDWNEFLYPNSAALHLDVVPTDTAIWYFVSDIYVPDSAYEFIAVGNFFENALLELTRIDSTGYGTLPAAYAFVDDIRTSFDLSYCTMTGVIDEPLRPKWTIYPNPATTHVIVRGMSRHAPIEFKLTDLQGRCVMTGVLTGMDGDVIPLSKLEPSLYFFQTMNGGRWSSAVPIVLNP